ncbi:sugar ABC transporter ATP-binding protein [Histidinibacterium lentulum]|uniref:Sugar ABC transporter ATP-binding protein n=1 Tax=Histidinibacterium lentulum TaxID=2480588 RepID=A0A3N2R868_9RHOB|nr:sugar ABC transporter ATP-binding protein [Histidinibacterium lentulum]ROU03635.1 sugar ABC transporter ATP-binding protein [Histidinibacterium lentulum]
MDRSFCRITGLKKAFGENLVLCGLDLELPAGRVTALMGANGAGKSTLVKILSGVYRRDGGRIMLGDTAFEPTSPADAIRKGIVTVHQSINDGVIPDLDVASNLMIDRLAEPGWGFFLRRRALLAEARRIAERMGLGIDVRTPVSELGVADRQLIAIARAMAHEPALLILDEPTSSLSAAEAQRLFDLVDMLKAQGVAILYISHRMSDIRRIADRIVSMRDGEIAGLFEGDALDYEGAVNAMLGHGLTETDLAPVVPGRAVVTLSGLKLRPDSAPFDLALHENEVVAVTGLLGSGKTALAQSLFGLHRPAAGRMALDGRDHAPGSPAEAIRAGVFMSAKDRASNAVIADFDIARNMTVPFLGAFSAASFVSRSRERQTAKEMIEALSIVCQSERDGILTLSGGNQQKVMLARWLSQECRILVLDEPFQGVDIRSRRDIGDKVRRTARGRATLVCVAELDEALEIADRIVVMHDHAVTAEFVNRDVDVAAILSAVTGPADPQETAA